MKPRIERESLVYGPVPSRRLGRSLGVDLVPHKVCSYDCIYCQLGRTTEKTIERRPYVSAAPVMDQVHRRIEEGLQADYVTLGGSGEPTLNSNIGEIIATLKRGIDLPVAVLTNSSLLWDPAVRDALLQADVVLPSLDVYDSQTFERINRPHRKIPYEKMLEGLASFRRAYKGKMWLEIFALAGVNVDATACEKFKELLARIDPDKVHVNTAVRPTSEAHARRVQNEELIRFCRLLGDKAEIIVPFQGVHSHGDGAGTEKDLLNLLARRPCTLTDIALSLNVGEEKLLRYIEPLMSNHIIETAVNGNMVYYRISNRNEIPYEEKEELHQS